jgi:hypothetical protein
MTQQLQLQLGLDVIRSYKRLSYSPWHAIAEFVDNSTQSYSDHQIELDDAFKRHGTHLEISIVYEREGDGFLRISDNAMGMSLEELDHALHVGARPANTSGRSEFGMGMKTAACWIGNLWTVRTKRLGEQVEHQVEVDVEAVADGANALPYQAVAGRDPEDHYTVIEIKRHNRPFIGRTVGKIRDFLGSMYREDLRQGKLTLLWQGEPLAWVESEDWFLQAPDGSRYKKGFEFEASGKPVRGWVGILERGSRAKAGFSILHRGRVVKGWPLSWRPESIYGQILGSNDLVNQRVIGEIHLDDFEVSHTKDDILWLGDEYEVQRLLKEMAADYVTVAKTRRRGTDERGPSNQEIKIAVEELQQELTSEEIVDLLSVEPIPPPEVLREAVAPMLGSIDPTDPTFSADIEPIRVLGYLASDASANDPYVVVDSTDNHQVMVVVNMHHPHVNQIVGSEGFLNYLRHCTYDAIAEWQARHKAATLDPHTIKILKDRLLRIPFEIEMHIAAEEAS